MTDCFAAKLKGGKEVCIALKEMYCKKGKCRFYKTKEQYLKERMVYPYTNMEVLEGRDD